jgi:hypothetical protein
LDARIADPAQDESQHFGFGERKEFVIFGGIITALAAILCTVFHH